jgi:hypothetical protein
MVDDAAQLDIFHGPSFLLTRSPLQASIVADF